MDTMSEERQPEENVSEETTVEVSPEEEAVREKEPVEEVVAEEEVEEEGEAEEDESDPEEVKPAKEETDAGDSPLTVEELLAAGKETISKMKDIPLKPLRRAVRMTMDSFVGAVNSAADSVQGKKTEEKSDD